MITFTTVSNITTVIVTADPTSTIVASKCHYKPLNVFLAPFCFFLDPIYSFEVPGERKQFAVF